MKLTVVSLLVAGLVAVGLFLLLHIGPRGIVESIPKPKEDPEKAERKRRMNKITGTKKHSVIVRYLTDAPEILTSAGKEKQIPVMKAAALALIVAGAAVSFALKNWFLLPVLAYGLGLLPFIWAHNQTHGVVRPFRENLKTTVGVINNTYLQGGTIVHSCETCLALLKAPFDDIVGQFVAEAKFINANVPSCLRNMKGKVDDRLFGEWVDLLIQCCDNQELKFVLPLIAGKIDDAISVQTKLDTEIAKEKRNFRILVVLTLLSVPLLFLLEPEWFMPMLVTPVGQFIMALFAALCIGALCMAEKILEPINYL